jgi:hypothetical protein
MYYNITGSRGDENNKRRNKQMKSVISCLIAVSVICLVSMFSVARAADPISSSVQSGLGVYNPQKSVNQMVVVTKPDSTNVIPKPDSTNVIPKAEIASPIPVPSKVSPINPEIASPIPVPSKVSPVNPEIASPIPVPSKVSPINPRGHYGPPEGTPVESPINGRVVY